MGFSSGWETDWMLEKRIEGETCYDGYFSGVEESMGLVGVGSGGEGTVLIRWSTIDLEPILLRLLGRICVCFCLFLLLRMTVHVVRPPS
jgi:hypothetical protein